MLNRSEIKILIVDDDNSTLKMLEEFLLEEGYCVLTASDGLEAVKTIQKEDLDIILTDLRMPGIGGIEVLKAAKKVNQCVHVVIVTGYASLDTALQAIKEGAYDYITKPFMLDEVGVVLKNVSEKVKLEREKRCLIEDLKKAYNELNFLRDSKENLDRNIHNIDRRMAEDQAKIARNLETLQTLPGDLLPFQYVQTKVLNQDITLNRLEQLGKLKEDGILTEEEFIFYKERLLRQI